MIIECSATPHIKGMRIKARCKHTGQATTVCYNSRQSLVDNAKYCLLQLCLILDIKGKSFVWCVVGDSVMFVSVLSCSSNVFSV